MLGASIFANSVFGGLVALIFVLYYIKGEGKSSFWVPLLIGVGGNAGVFFFLDTFFKIDSLEIRLYSVGSCIASFLIMIGIILNIFAHLIKDKDDKDIIRLRDILLGQTSWIDKYYETRAKQIDSKLNIPDLEKREAEIAKKENSIAEKEKYIASEQEKLAQIAENKLKFNLPENTNIVLSKEYIEAMPTYISDTIRCINNVNSCTKMLLMRTENTINITTIKSYFTLLATYISTDIFGGKTSNVRVHFRIYDKEKNGYVKLVAVIGEKIVNKDLTFIPYDKDNMIKRSYECRRALIKSINSEHDYKSNNNSVWKDYLTYTFFDIKYGDIPFLSFGISIKNVARYTKVLQFLNYFRIEDFLQSNIEQVDEYVNLSEIFYGG